MKATKEATELMNQARLQADKLREYALSLKRKLDEEKQNMGAADKRREDELLKEIANLKKELQNTN